MSARHLIRLLPDRSAEWMALARDGKVLSGPQIGLPARPSDDTVVLLPAEDMLLLRVPRVAKQRRQLEQAIPYAIEDQLAAPVEQMHVALPDRVDGDSVDVAVVARTRLAEWIAQLQDAGIAPDRALADAVLLPWRGMPVLWVEGTRALLRHGETGVLAGTMQEVPGWLALLETQGHTPKTLHWVGDGDPKAVLPAGWQAEREPCASPLRWFAAQLREGSGPNLLQGEFAMRRSRDDARRLWRWAAVFAIAAVLGGLTHAAVELSQLQRQYAAQEAEMDALLRTAVPGITRVVDPKAQLAAEQTRRQAGPGHAGIGLLAQIAPVVAGSGAYTLDALDYRADTLDLTLRTSDVARLDQLRASIAALPGIQAEVKSVTPGSGSIEGKLLVRGGAQ